MISVPGLARRPAASSALGLLVAASFAAFPVSAAAQTTAQSTEPGSELRVWLITAAPGAAIWERFGHDAIRVLDTRTGQDVSYNWGIFDFNQVDFVPRFLRGEMLYMMAGFRTAPMIDSYLSAGRPVSLQELDLTPDQKLRLIEFLEWNARPENRQYRYDYFLDNCSTRARDALDRALGGVLQERFGEAPSGTSYRFHTRRLTRMDPLLYTGMDLLLGTPGDQAITVWQEMFVPMALRDEIRSVRVRGPDGAERPLVLDERVLQPDAGPVPGEKGHPWGPREPPRWLLYYLLVGAALGGILALAGTRAADRRRAVRVGVGLLAGVWSLVAGVVGTVLILVLFTDHRFMAWNENLFLFTPLSLGLVVLAPVALGAGRWIRTARILARTVAALGLAGLLLQPLPWLHQTNAIFFALALPVHLGLAWALEQSTMSFSRRSS